MADPSPDRPTADTPARLTMRGIQKRFGATRALRGVALSVQAGQVLALVGENGAGKSTLMKVLSGAHMADEGAMTLDGRPYQPRNPLHARECGVAMIYQELSMAPHLTVMENILLGIESTRGPLMNWGEMRRRAAEALAEVGLARIAPDTPVRQLSVAHQQLVEIARAVALDSRVLVLDEPTSSLTLRDIESLFGLIHKLKSRGLAIVYISHFLEEVRAISDVFSVLRDGETVGGGVTAETGTDAIISMMVGRDVDDLYPRSARIRGEAVMEIGGLHAEGNPRDASLTLHRGEVLGIAGLVGAGRTELIEAIFGLRAVRGGGLKVMAFAGPASPTQRWRQGVGMLSEDRKNQGLALGLSIADNITLSRMEGLGPWQFVLPSRQEKASRPWIEKIPIKCRSAHQKVNALSGGNQQKVALARLLHADVDVLLLDEPTRGIDVGSKAQIYDLIDELAKGDADRPGRPARAILVVSSYLPELMGICDRIAVMCRGRLGEARSVEEWDEHQLMIAATGAEAATG